VQGRDSDPGAVLYRLSEARGAALALCAPALTTRPDCLRSAECRG
jgi:hypothetical protein